MQVSIPTSHLKAALNLAPEKDMRQYLNGIFVEAMQDYVHVVATDGSVLGVFRTKNGSEEVFSVIIPYSIVKTVLSLKALSAVVRFDATGWTINGIPFKPNDGKYPDYRRVVPKKCSNESAFFNPGLTYLFHKVAKDLKSKGAVIIRQNGNDAAQVQVTDRMDEFVGVVMPFRAFKKDEIDNGLASWASY